MKRLRQSLRTVLYEPTFFHGYRWLAWGGAALAMLVSDAAHPNAAFHIWLWVLIGVFNVLATALAQSYVRIARRRPAILGLDVLVSVALIWIGGGTLLPFLPYALGALVLPTMLFGWRAGLLASIEFILLDQVTLWTSHWQSVSLQFVMPNDSLIRIAMPVLFVSAFVWILRLLRQAMITTPALATNQVDRPFFPRNDRPSNPVTQQRASHFTLPRNAPRQLAESVRADAPVVAPLATMRTSDPTIEEWRRTLIALTPSTTLDLPVALELLSSGFEKRSGLEVRVAVIGHAKLLARPHYLTLLRLTQEALLNVQHHAHARHVIVTVRYELSQLILTVEDDGVGLLDGTYERPGLHALRALAYRLAEIDGTLEVFDGEQGLTVRSSVPIESY